MKRIELYGPSGVGKTTLLKEILAHRTKLDQWVTPGELRAKIARNISFGEIAGKRRMIAYMLLRCPLCARMETKLIDQLLAKYEEQAMQTCIAPYNPLIDLLLQNVASTSSEVPAFAGEPAYKAQRISFFLKVLTRTVLLFDYFDRTETALYDDPLVFGVEDKDAWQGMLSGLGGDQRARIIPYGVVNCRLSWKAHFERRKRRMSSGKVRFKERKQTDKELCATCKREQMTRERTADAMRRAGIRVMDIDMGADIPRNAKEVLSFIRSVT